MKHHSAIPVDNTRGVYFVARPVEDGEQSSTKQDCGSKTQCKPEDGDRCKLCRANVKHPRKCVKCGANLHCKWQCGAKIERKCQCGAKIHVNVTVVSRLNVGAVHVVPRVRKSVSVVPLLSIHALCVVSR